MSKKIISLVIAVAMVMGMIVSVPVMASGMFTDTAGHWAETTIEELARAGIINGKGNGLYDPQGTVTRAEFMKLLVCALGEYDSTAKLEKGNIADVKETDWYYTYVVNGLQQGVFSMDELNDSEFLPTQGMTRGDVARWMTNGLSLETTGVCKFTDIEDAKVKKAVTTAVAEGLITGYEDNTYRPYNTLTRAEAAVIVKRVMTKQTELTQLRKSPNEATFVDGVVQISVGGGKNVVVSKNEAAMTITFGNCTDSMKNLKPGQVFYVEPTAAEPEGVLSKVGSLTVDGDNVTINCVMPNLEEIFSKIDFATEVPVTMNDYVSGSSPEGVTVSEVKGAYDENGAFVAGLGDETLLEFTLCDLKFDRSESKNLVDVKKEFKSDAGLSGYIAVTSTAIVDLLIDPNLFSQSNYRASVKLANDVTASLTYERSAAYETKWDLANFSVNFYGPFSANIDMDLVFSASGEFEITTTASYSADIGVKYDNGQTSLIKDTQKSLSLTANAKGEMKIGPSVTLGVGVSVFGGSINFADVVGNLGIGVSGKTSVEHTLSQANGGGVKYTAHNNTPDDEGNIHICDVCVDGDAFVYLSGDAGISKDVTELLKTNEIRYKFDEERWTLTEWYCSVSSKTGVTFGLGECPNKYMPLQITSQPQNVDVTIGEPIATEVKAGAGANGTEKAKQMIAYKWYKDGKELSNQFTSTLYIPSATANDEGTYYCVAYYNTLGENALNATSNSVTVKVGTYEYGPTFTTQPQNQNVNEGFAVVLNAYAEAPEGAWVEYQWYKNGVAIGGANAASYAITAATSADAGTYYCVAWLSGYENLKTQSNSATVTVNTKTTTKDDEVLDTDVFGNNNVNTDGLNSNKNNNGNGVLNTDIFD